jgi:acetamidase/formamidase
VIRPLRVGLPGLSRVPALDVDRPRAQTAKLAWGPPFRSSPSSASSPPRPAGYGRISSIEPREFGGNVDCKEYVAGTSVFLPVFVPGANFSAATATRSG